MDPPRSTIIVKGGDVTIYAAMRRPALDRALVAAITLVAAARLAHAHVAPSVDDNNRYLKLTPMGDRVRLAYTVFFGEVPGAEARRTIDANHDGTISEAEAQAFGTKVATDVSGALDVELDGIQQHIVWADVVVGMGTQRTAAGSFSVDLIAYFCAGQRGKHRVLLHDRFRIPRPGETEVKVEDSPGITIERARVGPADESSHDYKFVGPGGPLTDDGLDLAYTATDKAPAGDTACATPAPGATASNQAGPTRWPYVVAALAALAAIAAVTLALRRRTRRGRSAGRARAPS
jgi:hypothetical protein